jgi:outer membrane lipoprotein-sorting protein
VNILRRLPVSRLLLLCGLVVAIGISAAALASALGTAPVPPPKPLAVAVHDALTAPAVEGVSANVTLTDHLIEGANLASGSGEASQFSSSPLISGASGRLWIAKDGRVRLELQAEKGDTQIIYDGHKLELYDASTNTLYRYAVPAHSGGTRAAGAARVHRDNWRSALRQLSHGSFAGSSVATRSEAASEPEHHEPPSVAKIEEAISHLQKHAHVSAATPADVAGQAAYTVRVSPDEGGSLLGGVELSWDAVHGVPLRVAVYSSTSSAPVIELAASEISYGPVDSSVFDFTPPSGAKVHELSAPSAGAAKPSSSSPHGREHPKLTTRGHGISSVAVLESKASEGSKGSSPLASSLPKVKINGRSATELVTPLGTLLSFERAGVSYLLAGSVTPSAIEAVARGL